MKTVLATAAVVLMVAGTTLADSNLTVNVCLQAKMGSIDVTRQVANYQPAWGTGTFYYTSMAVNSWTNSITVANVTTPGYAFARNPGTGTVTFIIGGGAVATMTFFPGDAAVFPCGSTTLTVNTATNITGAFEMWLLNR